MNPWDEPPRQPPPPSSPPPPRLSAAPYIRPDEDPDVVAARQAHAGTAGRINLAATPLAGLGEQLAALAIDLAPFAAFWFADRAFPGWQLLVGVVGVMRVVPLIFVGMTIGSACVGFRVLGPRGVRLNPLRAMLRELMLPLTVVWLAFLADELSGQDAMGRELDRRLLPDLLADTWPVMGRRG